MISTICPGGKRIVDLSVLSIDRDDTLGFPNFYLTASTFGVASCLLLLIGSVYCVFVQVKRCSNKIRMSMLRGVFINGAGEDAGYSTNIRLHHDGLGRILHVGAFCPPTSPGRARVLLVARNWLTLGNVATCHVDQLKAWACNLGSPIAVLLV